MAKEGKVQFGICKLHIARKYSDGYGIPHHMPGAEQLTVSNSDNTNNIISADNGEYYNGNGAANKTADLQVAKFDNFFLTQILGLIEEQGGLTESDGTMKEFAAMWEVDGDDGGDRYVWFDCTSTVPTATYATTNADGTITEASETATITAKRTEMADGTRRLSHRKHKGAVGYNTFFDKVPFAAVHVAADSSLSALTIGTETLSPTFDDEKTEYTVTTEGASATITATATATGATVNINVNGTNVDSGSTATWLDGENSVTITVTNGEDETIYRVTVNHTA